MISQNNALQVRFADYAFVRNRLLNREEIALLDVREEAPHATGHPLFAANLSLSRLELDAYTKLPRKDVVIVLIDAGEGLAEAAADRLTGMGYTQVYVFRGGIAEWREAGGELFIDVNVPSKAFGELLEAVCHTPSQPAQTVKKWLDEGEDMVVVDVRRFDEYQTMNIPTSVSVPGAELVLRIPELVPNPSTKIVINCAGRTRSLIGTQSLINAGVPNEVVALRNGTIGWTLADQTLEHGQSRTYSEVSDETRKQARARARSVADRAGVKRATLAQLQQWQGQQGRTTYAFDVRSVQEYESGHLPGFFSIPGGQLLQETEMYAPVRGARIVVVDDDGVRANMAASWLAQMAWDVYVLDDAPLSAFDQQGPFVRSTPPLPAGLMTVTAQRLAGWLQEEVKPLVIDASRYANYQRGHVPGACYLLRSLLESARIALTEGQKCVLTCEDGSLSAFMAPELSKRLGQAVFVLEKGNAGWREQGLALEKGEGIRLCEPIDRYRRPYEGTQVPKSAMQAYLDWEFGLVEQLGRDGTHHFKPLKS
ncbi:rhodanese-like domain-containing protein [Limnobacter sp.]|uniref:rhodanese-like domain-containing protein n=2 Tax=Limnobacter sp. TaxID=2003368 RepID=UPI0025894E70|nr:rhodanese-like domain-containing protein [Limnobacter sp.]